MARDREKIEPNEGDKRYIRRNEAGEFTEDESDVGRSLAQDHKLEAENESKPGRAIGSRR